jgi:hypothetical protein
MITEARSQLSTDYQVNSSLATITLSPSGSWTQSGFTDASNELGCNTNGGGTLIGWFTSSTILANNPAYITLIGSQDCLISHFKAQQIQSSGFHIEIPQRMYPQEVDPNPIVMMNYGSYAVTQTDTTQHYCGGFWAKNHTDNTNRKLTGFCRVVNTSSIQFREVLGVGNFYRSIPQYERDPNTGRFLGLFYNNLNYKLFTSDVVLGLPGVGGQFCMSRFRLRNVRVATVLIPQYQRIGDNGEWIHVCNGILWPWDNAQLPYSLFMGGT